MQHTTTTLSITAGATSDANNLEGLHLGDTFEARLVPAREDELETEVLVNGRRCFIQNFCQAATAGECWSLELVDESQSGTVYEAKPVELVEAGNGLTEIYKLGSTYDTGKVRKAHQLVMDSEAACHPDSIGLAGAILEVARDKNLPAEYRYFLATRVRGIYIGVLPFTDSRWLPLATVLAYSAPAAAREEAFRFLIFTQKYVIDTKAARASALGNLARILHRQKRYADAAYFYRRARKMLQDDFIASQLADCLAHLGQFEEAYKLIAHMPDALFGLLEGEWDDHRDDVLDEPGIND